MRGESTWVNKKSSDTLNLKERFMGLQPPLLLDDARVVVVEAAMIMMMMMMMIGCEMSMLFRRGGGKR